LEEAKAKLKDLDEIPVQNQTKQRRILKYSERHVSRCIQGLIVALVIWWLFPTLQHSDYDKGCFQENYEYPFQQDLPLIGYFKTHKPLIGREWLFAKIQDSLEQTKPRGVLLLAQMGYGKSALISLLLCAKRNEKGRHIRDKMVAFHICKFDVKSTRNPARFIRRMIGFFATRSPEYGSIISMLPTSSIIFDMYACEREIEACFDAAILNPLKEIEINKTGLNDWIIVVDALDECYDNSLGRNPLKDILFSRIKQMPTWTKLLLTSRNFSVETRIRQYMHSFHLSTDDSRNIEDMKMFILSKVPEAGSNMDRLTDISEGNFLYMSMKLILHYVNNLEHLDEGDETAAFVAVKVEELYNKKQ
ncbi:uncharacterized protein LOC128208695, partial [Mya arenaria]|uniref:uncharacterized protein LOC128208695 n=1 Tax=Mya arenaria TaxID=6604 RepID=UPI0022E29343